MARPDPERVWLGFAQAAGGGAMSIEVEIDPAVTTWEETRKMIASDCAAFADDMLEQWKLRYGEDDAPVNSTRGVKPSDVKALPETTAPKATAVDW